MTKIASDATLLRQAKTSLKITENALSSAESALSSAERQRDSFRKRAFDAEQEVATWKARFDLLLTKAGKIDAA